ncbi:BspA family leucine-rich repeat surface protein [uncultured Prevotella sp.]|uniref:BspA family leucine-rich repeat surface protein n=1 Tax=uncultured Prevotella sp. TaxID=159272 RepID=UPI0027E33B1C|nr:BspA family leucine-rich repeat surface protein [uncultured Prevotella sp.]
MKKSTISKQWSYTTDLYSTNAYKSRKLSMLWLMLLTLLLVPTRMVAQATTEDTRYDLFNSLDGITDVTIKDNGSYPWQELDLKAEGMENVSSYFTEKSKGLMSGNYKKSNTTSETVIEFNVEKSMLFSFKYLVSSEQKYDVFTITLDGKKLEGISGTSQNEYKRILSVGKHSLTLSYKKDQYTNKGADRAFIYDLKTSTTIDGYVAEYDATNYTLTFKKITSINSEAIDLNRIVMVNNKQTVINLCSLLGIKIRTIKNVIFEESFNTYTPTSLKEFFSDCTGLNEITGLKYLNTAEVTDMSHMFWNCRNLSSLDLTNFNTTKVENMFGMFFDCENLSSLVISNFNTANVTDMSNMFYLCKNLSSLDIPNFNTANVTDMSYMFDTCQKLTELNLSNFKTEKVKNMRYMFSYCNKLKKLNLSNFNTANVTNMTCMFINCKELSSLDISNFNTAKVKDMSSMFKNCQVLSSLDLSNFNTTKVTDMSGMFSGCSMLQTIYVSDDFVVTGITNDSYKKDLFTGCEALPAYVYTNTSSEYANYKTGYFTKLVVRNGDERYGIKGETTQLTVDNLALTDNKDLVVYEPFTATAASYSRNINTGKTGTTWATLCLPFEVSLENQNFRAFKLLSANEGTNTIELEDVENNIPAGTPVIIKMTNGATELNFSEANKNIAKDVQTSETADGDYQLQGLYTQKEFSKDADNNCYIVKGNKLMNPAKLLANTNVEKVVSKPFRAYMVDKTSAPAAGAKMFSIGFDDNSTTAIDSLNTIANDKAEYYDLQGKRLNEPQKGINIVKRGGKTMKVIIK